MRVPQGQPVTVTVEIREEPVPPATIGELVDPTTIVLELLGPLGLPLIAAAPPTRDSLGKYRVKLDDEIATIGHSVLRWTTTGPGAGVKTDEIDVYDPFASELLTLLDGKKYLGIAPENTEHDDEVESFIRALTPAVEFFAGPVEPKTVRRTVVGQYEIVLPLAPVISITSITSYGSVLDVADFTLDSDTGIVRYTDASLVFPIGRVDVIFVPGRRVIHEGISHGAKVILDHLWETQRGRGSSGYTSKNRTGDTTFIPALGYSVPNRAIQMLKPHNTRTGLS